MVTTDDAITSSESASSPEATETIPTSGDEPLIPVNFVEGKGVVDPSAETAPAATTGDEASSDETATDDTQETTESTEDKPAAETTDSPEAKPAGTETEATDGETAAPRTYSQEERNNQEATYQRKFDDQEKVNTELRTQMSQMGGQLQDQLIQAQASGYITALTERYQDDGMDERQATDRATSEVNAGVADWKTQQENAHLRQQVTSANTNSENVARNASIDNVMTKYSVPENQRELLHGFTDARLMDSTAEALGKAESERQTNIKAKQAEVPAGGPANTFDKGAGGSTPQSGEDWLLNVYNPGFADTPADHAKAREVQVSLGWV